MREALLQPLLFSQMLLLSAAACATESYPVNNPPAPLGRLAPVDGLLVKFKPHINQQQAREIAQSYGAREVLPLSTPQQANTQMAQWHHLKFAPDTNLQQTMQRIAQDANVETVELNGVVSIQKP